MLIGRYLLPFSKMPDLFNFSQDIINMQSRFRTIFIATISTLVLFGAITADATSRHPVRGNNGVVASSSAIASEAGVEILKKCGN